MKCLGTFDKYSSAALSVDFKNASKGLPSQHLHGERDSQNLEGCGRLTYSDAFKKAATNWNAKITKDSSSK